MEEDSFSYSSERFGDIQMLRYRLDGFNDLTLKQKLYIYCLAKATLWGRDITFHQFGKYNLQIREALEYIFVERYKEDSDDFKSLELYLKKVWFSNGIHHHYGMEKFIPTFSHSYFIEALNKIGKDKLGISSEKAFSDYKNILSEIIFNPKCMHKRVNRAEGTDVIRTSSNNFYENVSQKEVEQFYIEKKRTAKNKQLSFGLNSTLVKRENKLEEIVWKIDGRYGKTIKQIVFWLNKAENYCENNNQKDIIHLLIDYYTSGELADFDKYSIKWVTECEGQIDFINGFIEVYGDALGLKGSWEGIVHYKDLEATRRTKTISSNAQWFEDHSPVDKRFRKKVVKGITANVVCAAMLGGDEYPASAIGINLPNADWIRAEYGSKSVTISNLTDEFVIDAQTRELIENFGSLTDELHTDLHECLGHGSGKLLSGVDPDSLKNYGNTIEEARADLFGLYYMADRKLLELGLLKSEEAFKAQYYSYIMNGLITQLARIKPNKQIEEAHMQNRALIAWWAYEIGKSDKVIELVQLPDGKAKALKTFVRINDYAALRQIFAQQLAEIQRVKSMGDFNRAKELVETYAVKVNKTLHNEVLSRYEQLNIAPYKGFINPVMKLEYGHNNQIVDVKLDYTETYTHQMMRYSKDYSLWQQEKHTIN